MILIRRVIGASMQPALYEGDIVIAWRKKSKVGDIVIAKVKGREVIKRITRFSPARLFLQGDNAAQSTDSRQYGPIETSDIIGVVSFTIKNHKK